MSRTHHWIGTCLLVVPALSAGIFVPQAKAEPKLRAIKIQVYSSLVRGISESDAKEATRPLINLLSKEVDYPLEFGIKKGTTEKDLLAFGSQLEKMDDDTVHLGVFWGLECGWLFQRYQKLKPFVLVSNGGDKVQVTCVLLAHKEHRGKTLKDLEHETLARYASEPLMNQLYLREMLERQKLNPNGFFKDYRPTQEPLNSGLDAVHAVKDRKATCVFLTIHEWFRMKQLQEGVCAALTEIDHSVSFPLVAMIGSPEKINRLKPGLWDSLQTDLLALQTKSEGRKCVSFWRCESFIKPDPDYRDQALNHARKFPIKSLTEAE